MNLNELITYCYTKYKRRNSIYLPSLADRFDFLALGVRNLHSAVEKRNAEMYPRTLASLFVRTCVIVGSFEDMAIVDAFARKYPMSGCVYCGSIPCSICDPKKRPEAKIVPPDARQLLWTLSDFQFHLKRVYGEKNEKKGIDHAFIRLSDEVAELKSLRLVSTNHTSLDRMYEEYALEITDVYARTIAIANLPIPDLPRVDLEDAVIRYYWGKCPDCRRYPCNCGPFNRALRNSFAEINAQSVPG